MQINSNSSITFEGRKITCSEIEKYSRQLEHNLALCNLKKDDIVGIALNRSFWSIIAMYTLYRLKIPYLIINCTFPENRIEYMLGIVDTKCIITDKDTTAFFKTYKTVSVDNLEDGEAQIEFLNSEIMYLAFTSGSTGNPKAIAISFEAFNNFAEAFLESGALDGISTGICTTDFGFDIIYCETFIPLMVGINIFLATEEDIKNIRKRCSLIKDNGIEFMQCTPSALMIIKMNEKDMSFLGGIKTLILGGEALPDALLSSLSFAKNTKIYNFYGPTETTIWSTYSDLTQKKTVNIGKPLSNTSIYILDDNLNPVAEGEIGEICIGGSSLAIGYYHNPEATQKSFVNYNGERIYKTGDLGHIENGTIFCHNRKDYQVKIRGHRIEPGEIDSHIMNVNGVKRAVSSTLQTETGAAIICFYISDEKVSEKIIRDNVSQFLPDYMIPSVFVRCEEFLYTANGKTDCKSMVSEYLSATKKDSVTAKDSARENAMLTEIAKFFSEHNICSCESIDENTRMDALSINSVGYVSLVVYFEEMYEFEFDDDYLSLDSFETVGELMNYIKNMSDKTKNME